MRYPLQSRHRKNTRVDAMLQQVGLMRGWMCALTAFVALSGAIGCVERRMVIITDPFPDASNAIVYDEKGPARSAARPSISRSPITGSITSASSRTVSTRSTSTSRVRSPWYELPGFDFISENLIPFTIRDVKARLQLRDAAAADTPAGPDAARGGGIAGLRQDAGAAGAELEPARRSAADGAGDADAVRPSPLSPCTQGVRGAGGEGV